MLFKQLDIDGFHNYLHIDRCTFENLLLIISPLITKKNTKMRELISAIERLVVTLRFLITGSKYTNLQIFKGISPQSLSFIICGTCTAISKCLRDYIKVNKIRFEENYLFYIVGVTTTQLF